jgi:hypothetical protein
VVADWFFVIGPCLEISGGALIAGEILFASGEDVAARGITFPSGEPAVEAQRGPAMKWVGFGLLLTGFVVQLVGYVVDSDYYWFFAVAPAVILTTFIAGHLAANPIARLRHHRATRYAHEHWSRD